MWEMSELQGRRGDKEASSTTLALDSRNKPKSTKMPSKHEDNRHWAKPYRTVIASSSSSIVATLAGVSPHAKELEQDNDIDVLMLSIVSL